MILYFRDTKRVTLREEDMTVEKISKIFQVTSQSLYLTDDTNVAVFPGVEGLFSSFDLKDKAHYEVHGAGAELDSGVNIAAGALPTPSTSGQFRFSRLASSASPSVPPRAQSMKYFTRTVSLGEVRSGKLVNSRMVVVRFTEQEASVPSMIAKVKDALGSTEQLILTDHNGVEILDSEGTRGTFYWKQNARKIMAIPEVDFQAVQQKRRRISHRDDEAGLDSVFEKIEELVLAAQGLSEVTTAIQGLSDLVHRNRNTTLVLTEEQSRNVRDTFTCLVCRGIMDDPVFAACCGSLVGCRSCTTVWLQTSSMCLKCRADNFSINIHRVTGLSGVVNVMKELAHEE
ncbi:uncharacterized protein LOC120489757 isoform X2 [Pimephales promelas]|uniref:uncharacterized protein LOC120489757 isoform X1 n=2 Tax=Pimephales promelas TaxID=90988 RepID=UPI00195557F6|nr:uncharacterized protein LOC120489757 isoform X1 [Pimephales promelas]XP_039542774.1 uncharacterized protein LOC120489757 isoform X2 [Pimephales promelas]